MAKYTELCQDLITALGGKENIKDAVHCMTRLRVHVNDESKVNEDGIKAVSGVAGLVKQAGQYQIVIGQHVADVYAEFVKEAGVQAQDAIDENLDQKPMTFKEKFFDFVSGIMMPFVMILAGCAIVSAINVILSNAGLYGRGDGIYTLLNAIGNTVVYFMPCFIGYTTAKKLNVDPMLGMAIGAAMMHPNISGVDLNLFGHAFNNSYASSMLPAVLTVLFACPIEHFLKKHLPAYIKGFMTPAITLLIAVPVGYCLIGPAANWFGTLIGGGLNNLIAAAPVAAGALIGGLYEVFVVFGIHNVISLPSVTNVLSGVPDSFSAMRSGACFACAGACLAVAIRSHSRKTKDIATPAFFSAMFGVTEPALYGVMVERLRVFAAVCIGGAVGGAVAGILGCKMYGLAAGGIFQFVGYINPDAPTASLINIVIVYIINFAFAFLVAMVMFKEKDSDVMAHQKKLI